MRSVIVLGGSAGGIQSLSCILAGLPPDLSAGILAVIHTTEQGGLLPQVLARSCEMEVVCPKKAEPIRAGRVYLPAPNRHLVVSAGCARSWMGPRENRHRPSVDTLFRSAARAYRAHVIAVILSGALDDGAAGSMAVKARGGKVIVQDPADAQVEDMPANVLRQVKTDHCVRAAEIPKLLIGLVAGSRSMKRRPPSVNECEEASVDAGMGEREPSGFTCPDCGGAVMHIHGEKRPQFRCHVGHTFSLESFSEAHADALERAMWVALRKLNEQRSIHEMLARRHTGAMQRRYRENAAAAEHDMRLIHEILARL